MTIPPDPVEPPYGEVSVASNLEPPAFPPPDAEPAYTTPDTESSEHKEHSTSTKVKAAALLAGVTALANKVREEAPKKVQEIREKRAAGRCVILTEVDGRATAIGPYPNTEAAQADVTNVGVNARVVELVPNSAFFDTQT